MEKMDDLEENPKSESPELSDSDEDMSDEDEIIEEEIKAKEQAVETNVYKYDLHIQLIALLRKHGDLEKLRKARENMNKIFPLSPELWLDWLSDESKLAVDKNTRQSVTDLFNGAVADYNSVDVWLEFCQFSIGKLSEPDGAEEIRKIFERAITAVGIHFQKGSLVWEAYREFENALLSMMQPAPGNLADAEKQKSIDGQIERISSLFRRQLSIPHLDMEKIYEEFVEWESEEISNNFHISYKAALKMMKNRSSFENDLESSENPHLNEYFEYINFEEKEGDPARIQSLYERAIIDNCLVPDLWSQYCTFIDKKLKIADISVPAHERSVRNCPWSVNLWIIYMKAFERFKKPFEEIQSLFERALQAGFSTGDEYRQLWLAFLESCARRVDWSEAEDNDRLSLLRSTFKRAVDYLSEYFPKDGDPYCTVQQYWARLEARHLKNMDKSRKIWTDIMSHGNGKYAQMWVEYYNLERSFGDIEHERTNLQMGVQCASDNPETIVEMLLMFEKDVGTFEELDAATARCQSQMSRVSERRAKAVEKEAEKKQAIIEQRKQNKFFKDTNRRTFTERNTSAPVKDNGKKFPKPQGSHLQKSLSRKPPQFVREGESQPEENEFKEPLSPTLKVNPRKRPPPGFQERVSKQEPESKKPRTVAENEPAEQIKDSANVRDPAADDRTVFLSNLLYFVDEDVIKDIFKSIGPITDLRIVKDFRGRSKGYGYLEFENQANVEAALEKDRYAINGRPMYVSRCKSNKTGAEKFKYETSLERNKLFVRGLNFDTTKEDLEDYFKQFGKLKGVRLVTFKNGNSKGLAFVEYEDDSSAAVAVVKADGITLQDRQISVAISNPPARKGQTSTQGPSTSQSFLGAPKQFGSRGRGHTNLSMVPRSVPKKELSSKATENGSGNQTEGPKPKLSNDDFRNMLLRK